MSKNEFGDWCIFKLEDTDYEHKCIICKKVTKKAIVATHIVHKRMQMGMCCSEECFKKYKVKYGI